MDQLTIMGLKIKSIVNQVFNSILADIWPISKVADSPWVHYCTPQQLLEVRTEKSCLD